MPAIIAVLVRVLLTGLSWLVTTQLGQWVAKLLLAFGIGVVVHQVALPDLMAFVQSHASGLSPLLLQTFGAVGGDVAVTMILSSVVATVTGSIAFRALSKS